MPAPLEGIRVLDLSRLLPGPLATQLLADYGAEVIKVEEPGRGDYMRGFAPAVDGRSAFFLNVNRGKKSLALDLKAPQGREVFLDLAGTADVVVESFRPGVLDRLGIGYQVLAAANPRLILCSITGYGQSGPHAGDAGHDLNYQALAGTLGLARDPLGHPVVPGYQLADVGGGAYAGCLGILLALLARERSGRGQRVDAPMLDGLLPFLTYRWACYQAGDPDTYLSGEVPCYAVYAAADGGFLALGALEPQFWERFCRHVERDEWIPLQFADGVHRDRLFDEVRSLLRTRSRDHWVETFRGVDCCLTPVLELAELEDSPHWRLRGLIHPLRSPEGGTYPTLGPPVQLSETGSRPGGFPPELGAHSRSVLEQAGYDPARIEQLVATGVVSGS